MGTSKYITIDIDRIRQLLPEYPTYYQQTPYLAGQHTQKEAGLVVELLTDIVLSSLPNNSDNTNNDSNNNNENYNYNVIVDGSLKDAEWYELYFQKLKLL